MRHGVKRSKLNRNMGERKALVRSLAIALFTNERIVTTRAKAKVLKPFADQLLARAKQDNVATRRLLLSRLPNESIVEKLLKDIAPRYTDRASGFSRIVYLGKRKSDASPMARIELVDLAASLPVEAEKKTKKENTQNIAVERSEMIEPVTNKGVKKLGSGKVMGSERVGKTKKEKTVSRRQVSTKKAGMK